MPRELEPVPDETTICKFRHLLEAHELGPQILAAVNAHLAEQRFKVSTGTIVDATIISAPSSTKNRDGELDPEMHQTKKGNEWHFGMKAQIGVDSREYKVLRRLQQERREKDVESKLSEEKPLEEVRGRVLKASPTLSTLSTLFLKGQRLSKPFAGAGSQSGEGGGAEKKGEAAFNARRHPTNHTDFVVAPLDQMLRLWSAVNRISKGGEEIGIEQRVAPLAGLKAMTLWGAEQYGEEASKGSLEVGKLADLVVLDGNPLKVKPQDIKGIQVLETIKEGKTIFRAQ